MTRLVVIFVVTVGLFAQSQPGAREMFYNPGDLDPAPTAPLVDGLRPVRFASPFLHCGIHVWLETADGTRLTVSRARTTPGPFRVRLRNNVGHGALTVWNLTTGTQLTPLDPRWSSGGRWSGVSMTEDIYTIPGEFRFSDDAGAAHLSIVWARSQTEVAHSAKEALARLTDMPRWMPIVTEHVESPASDVGTYVMNRHDAGVSTEIRFRN